MFTFLEMLVMVVSESSFGAYVYHRRPVGLDCHQRLLLPTVILQFFGVVLFSVFSVVKDFSEIKKTPIGKKNALNDHGIFHQH